MIRLAIISDVHADVHALRDALVQIKKIRCERIVCAGDLLDWGLFPEKTLKVLQEENISCIRGNHDRWAVRECRDGSGWDLTSSALKFLDSLPTHLDLLIEGIQIAIRHARPPINDMDGLYPDSSADDFFPAVRHSDVLILGHTHIPMEIYVGNKKVVNPGALLRDPAEPMIHAGGTFGVLEIPSRKFTVHRARDGVEVEIARRNIY